MDIRKRDLLAASFGIGGGLFASRALAQQDVEGGGRGASDQQSTSINSGVQPSSVDMNYKPRRVNKMIELWEDGQPVYFTHDGLLPGMSPEAQYAQGKKMAKTYCDGIEVNFEHGPLDFTAFANFMRGLRDGGPTKSGHATPSVWVVPPCTGLDEQYALANAWIIGNFLDLGAMGVSIVHARDPMAIEVYAQMAARYPFDYPNTPKVPRQGLGLRGQGPGQAPEIWGISTNKYFHTADVWPLNPRGELMIGVKIEDKFANANVAKTLSIKGICFGEHLGGGDETLSNIGLAAYPEDQVDHGGGKRTPHQAALLEDIRRKVVAEFRKNNIMLQGGGPAGSSFAEDVKAGMMMAEAEAEAEAKVRVQREFTKRKMPV